jgi:hypothetical protein
VPHDLYVKDNDREIRGSSGLQGLPRQGRAGSFAWRIRKTSLRLDGVDPARFPIGTQGRATIYTNPDSAFVVLRKIGIRACTWFNWIYPFSG